MDQVVRFARIFEASAKRDFRQRLGATIFAIVNVCVCLPTTAQEPNGEKPSPRTNSRTEEPLTNLNQREWTIDGAKREALVYFPTTAAVEPSPVVFAFHGHGGTMQRAATMFGFHRVWPEAIVVYMQGLNTPGRLTDPEGKRPGWQGGPGAQGDRDLKFFDAVLATLKSESKVDVSRIYATGHSNGGGFTYLLWSARGDVFAALAPSAASGPGEGWAKMIAALKPKPVMHLAGEKDPLVKFEWQERTMESLRKTNGCDESPTVWAKWCKRYTSSSGYPVVTLIHPGAHNYPPEAPELIVKFFKKHAQE